MTGGIIVGLYRLFLQKWKSEEMKTVGIIAEYNPFHNGHKFHIEESKRLTGADCVVSVMSGNFVQRGEPAIYNKWVRAEAAVLSGADLVIEIPAVFSCATAEVFAEAGVRLLCSLGSVDYIAFGAEEESIEKLQKTADFFTEESDELKRAIKENLKNGMSYAGARSAAAETAGMEEFGEIICKPNNILAVEYLKQLNILKNKNEMRSLDSEKGETRERHLPKPVLIVRKSAGYYEANPDEGIAGAGKLRDMLRDGIDIRKYLPNNTAEENDISHFANEAGYRNEPCFPDRMFEFVEYKLLSESATRLNEIDGAVEGLENRAVRAASEAIDHESLINLIKTKRYSRTAIQRMLTRMLLGITKSDMQEFRACEECYARVLAFSEKGARLLRKLKKDDVQGLSILTNINREKPENEILVKMLNYDIKAGDLYDLLCYGRPGVNSDHRMKPYFLKNTERD